jgi:hypothetical protein
LRGGRVAASADANGQPSGWPASCSCPRRLSAG